MSFTDGQSFQFSNTVWRDDVDDMVTEIFEDVPKDFSQMMNCRRQLLFGLLRVARFEDKKLLVLSQKISERTIIR